MDRIARRYWMCLVVGICATVFESMFRIEERVRYGITLSDVNASNSHWVNPFVPGAYSCPHTHITRTQPQEVEKALFLWNRNFNYGFLLVISWIPIITHLPSGVWADLYGGHRIIFWSLLSSSLLHLFTPFAISCGDSFYIGITVLRRVFAGTVLPSFISLLAHWALPEERTTFVAVLYSFKQLGRLILITTRFNQLWVLFYASSLVSLLASIVWWQTARLWHDRLLQPPGPDLRVAAKKVPLLRMVTSPNLLPLYLLAVASEGFCFLAGKSIISYYLDQTLMFTDEHLPITVTVLSMQMLFYVFSDVCIVLAVGVVSDRLVPSGLVSLPTVRRLFLATATVGATLSVLLLIPAQCNVLMADSCFSAFVYFAAWQRVVLWTLTLDVAPCLAGTLISLIRIVSSLGDRVMFQSAIRFARYWGVGDLQVWAVVFITFAIVILILPVPYLVWGPFYELPWAKRPSLDAAPNTLRSRIARVLLSMATILLICVFVVVISIFV